MNKRYCLPLLFALLFSGCIPQKTVEKQPAVSPLEAELQKLREAGIPTTIEELNLPEIPDEENAALVYQKAFDLMEKNKEDINILKSMFYTSYQKDGRSFSHFSDIPEWSKWSDEQKELFPSLIRKNEEIFILLEKAVSMPKCRFPVAYEEGPAMLLPHLSKLHNCAYLLAIKATIEAATDSVKTLDTLLVGFEMGKSLSNEPLLLSQSIRISIDKTILVSIQNLLNEKSVTQNQYEKLIKEFEEERKMDLISYALQGVFLQIEWYFDDFKKHPERAERLWKSCSSSEELFQKYISSIEVDETYVAGTFLKLITLTKQPYWEVKQKFEGIFKDIYALPIDKHFLSLVMFPVLSKAYQMEAYSDALLGAAQIGIANRLYKQKHGKFADTLNQLSPEILPALPLDPFTGKDYIYRKKDKGFIVYSVADNLKDDGGVPQFSEEGKKTGNFDIVWEDNCNLDIDYEKIRSEYMERYIKLMENYNDVILAQDWQEKERINNASVKLFEELIEKYPDSPHIPFYKEMLQGSKNAAQQKTIDLNEFKRTLEMGCFKQLELAFSIYLHGHNGIFPEKLEDVLKPIGMESYLICPIHKVPLVYHKPSKTLDQIKTETMEEFEKGKFRVIKKADVLVECPQSGHSMKLYSNLIISK